MGGNFLRVHVSDELNLKIDFYSFRRVIWLLTRCLKLLSFFYLYGVGTKLENYRGVQNYTNFYSNSKSWEM